MRSGEQPQWREKTYGGVKCPGPVLLPEPTTHPDQPCARGLYGSLTNLFLYVSDKHEHVSFAGWGAIYHSYITSH